MMLGGRAAENVIFGRITTGAQNDLEKVTQQAYAQVKKYGMSELVGPISFANHPSDEHAAQFYKKPYSKKLGQIIDEEVQRLVGRAYFFTEQLLRDNEDKLQMVCFVRTFELIGFFRLPKLFLNASLCHTRM
jgi:ATP-dependent Zn protease